MTQEGIEVDGLRELIKSARNVDRDLPKGLTRIHKAIAEPIAAAAAARAPNVSGRLAGSIRALGTQRVARVAAGKKAVPYAGPIHFGWPAHNIAGQPFLTDALADHRITAVAQYQDELAVFIDSVWVSIP